MHPALLIAPFLALLTSQLFYALLPYSKRNYLAILVLTAIGFALGEGWQFLQLPSIHIGEGNVLPGLLFAAALQPLAPRLPIHFR
ncbi:MAG: hypothetical protein M3Z98_03590 [Candidatus Dormibacteraeota bacterium]|nr:hypothetical protein [Candidatus Dormibacteraeota bacterium]